MTRQPGSATTNPAVTDTHRILSRRVALTAVRWARRWGWLILLLVGGALFGLLQQAIVATGDPVLVPSLIFIGAVTVPASFACFAAARVGGTTLSTTALLGAAVVGGVAGLVSASLVEYQVDVDTGALTALSVAVTEETAKLVAPLIGVLLLGRRSTLADGFMIGVASSAGFAALETMGYAAVMFVQSPHLTEMSSVDLVLLWRGMLSPAGHIAWTGMTSTALWYAVQRGWPIQAVSRFVAAFVLAVALHTIWDSWNNAICYVTLSIVGLTLLAYTGHRTRLCSYAGQ